MRLSSKKSKNPANPKETKNLIRLVVVPHENGIPFNCKYSTGSLLQSESVHFVIDSVLPKFNVLLNTLK